MTTIAGFFGLTVWGFWLTWIALGWLTGGVVIWLRALQGNANRTMGFCLVCWPIAWGAVVLAALTGAALYVFNPDDGPIAFGWRVLKTLTHWEPAVRPLVREPPKP